MATLSTCWSVAWGVNGCLFVVEAHPWFLPMMQMYPAGLFLKLLGFFCLQTLGPHLAEALCVYPFLNIFVAHHLIGLELNTSKLKSLTSQTTNQWSLSHNKQVTRKRRGPFHQQIPGTKTDTSYSGKKNWGSSPPAPHSWLLRDFPTSWRFVSFG